MHDTAPPPPLALSVLIPTRDRLESLRLTLEALGANATEHVYEVVVIDNGSTPPLARADVNESAGGVLSSRVLREDRSGKAHAINRALDAGGLAPLIAVLDDDMTPAPDWIDGVIAASARLPDHDIFSGRSYVVWPDGVDPPAWANHPLVLGIAFSVADLGPDRDVDMSVGPHHYPSGNQFWFRRAVLRSGVRFPDAWPPELPFVIALRAAGHGGVFARDVVAGHRAQIQLVDTAVLEDRTRRFARDLARVEATLPDPSILGAPAHRARWYAAVRAMLAIARWTVRGVAARRLPPGRRAAARARAILGRCTNVERLAIALRPQRVRYLRNWIGAVLHPPADDADSAADRSEAHRGDAGALAS